MEIKHDKSYLGLYADMKATGFTNEAIEKICFQGNYSLDEHNIIKEIADYLESNFKMYQYKKDNEVKFNQEELFCWTNEKENMLYFDVTVKADTIEKHNSIVNSIIEYVTEHYQNTELYIRLQYKHKTDYQAINEYLRQDFNIADLPLNIFQPIYNDMQYTGRKYTSESIEKLNNIAEQFISQYVDKKVLWNSEIKGTIKKLSQGYALFKPRSTKTYYNIDLKNIKSLVVI